mmetsp:Transcript_24458/g.38124  ORF Transcript_24458/g.38124 Transcript_24458/m.38124 type:complete len:246 (-) Transcript_24458:908-1645(-)
MGSSLRLVFFPKRFMRGGYKRKVVPIENLGQFRKACTHGYGLELAIQHTGDWVAGAHLPSCNLSKEIALGHDTVDVPSFINDRKLIVSLRLQNINSLAASKVRQNSARRRDVQKSNLLFAPRRGGNIFFNFTLIHEIMRNHPVVTQKLRHVISHSIRHNDNHPLTFFQVHSLGNFESTCQVCTRGSTNHQSFLLDQTPGHAEARAILTLDPLINHRSIKNSRNEVVSNTFHLVRFDLLIHRLWNR